MAADAPDHRASRRRTGPRRYPYRRWGRRRAVISILTALALACALLPMPAAAAPAGRRLHDRPHLPAQRSRLDRRPLLLARQLLRVDRALRRSSLRRVNLATGAVQQKKAATRRRLRRGHGHCQRPHVRDHLEGAAGARVRPIQLRPHRPLRLRRRGLGPDLQRQVPGHEQPDQLHPLPQSVRLQVGPHDPGHRERLTPSTRSMRWPGSRARSGPTSGSCRTS